MRKKSDDYGWLLFIFILPSALFMLFIFTVPLVFSLLAGFTDWSGLGFRWNFVGLANYFEMLRSKEMHRILINMALYLFFLVFIQNVVALFIALLLNKTFRLRNFVRSVLFMPTVIATVAVGFIWSLLLDPVSGVFPFLAAKSGLSFLADFTWLGSSDAAIFLVILISMWQWTGLNAVIFLAGLQGIPAELYEAGDIDGVSDRARLTHITLPLLQPAIKVNIILTTISVFKIFDLPYVLTKGGPGFSTESVAIMIYSRTFMYDRFGYGAAISLTLFVVVMLVTLIQLRLFAKAEEGMT
jgi:ABC-type sugar transport system permease subunit